MRPIKLVMSAFGPYKDEEKIDFKELNGRNIFVISGKTGAGKTTIFDAITYALYGEASGESREVDSFRSDFANDEVETFVELEFELKRETYKLKRIPRQLKKKSRGEGYTEKSAEAILEMPDGKIITKANNVNSKVIELMGITKEQFKQIVMLPQGEFKKLLLADSSEREGIFRKIFDTYDFEKMQTELKEEAKELENRQKESQNEIKTNLKNIIGNLNVEIGEYPDIPVVLEELKKLIETDKSNYEKNMLDQKEIDNYLQEIKKVSDLKEDLEKKKVELIEDLKIEEELKEKIQLLEKELKEAVEELKSEEKNEEYRDKLKLELQNSKTIESQIDEIEKLKKERDLNQELLKKVEEMQKKSKQLEVENQSEFEKNEIELKQLIDLETQKLKLDNLIKEKEESRIKLRDIYSKIVEYEKLKSNHKTREEEYKKFEIEYEKLKKEQETKEEIYKKEQAGILASNLKDNEPCPVCGSTTHPQKAVLIEQNQIPTEEELKKLKEERQEYEIVKNDKLKILTELHQDLKNRLEILEESLQSFKEGFETTSYSKTRAQEVKERGIKLKEEIEELQKQNNSLNERIKTKETIENKNLKIKEIINNERKKQENLIEEEKKKIIEIQNHSNKIEEFAKKLPQNISSKEEIVKEIGEKDKALRDSIQRLEILRNKNNELGSAIEKECGKLEIKTQNIKDKKELILKIEKDFKALKLSFKIETDEEIQNQLKEKQIKIEELKKQEKEIYAQYKNNEIVFEKVTIAHKKVEKIEKRYRLVGELSDLANGKKSPYISFERYILASYFEDIIDAANLRLEKMTGDRFSLMRKEGKSKGAGQKGLELEVYDNYTDTSRDVSSLSGGESFKASLSLALGLSDVVQANAGGVSLDTIFVDEGFGNLDPQSLDNAIDSLLELQRGGRLVGIISHVEELKERIEAKLEVIGSPNGSKVKFNIMGE